MVFDKVQPDIPQRGKHKALIAFVGDAPGSAEILRGRPFAGPSGRILNAMLRTAGIDRADHLVTNVFDTQLPSDKVDAWCSPAGDAQAGGYKGLPPIGSAGYLRPEHFHHLERLQRELQDWQPDIIVALGGVALWALTGNSSIASMRGGLQPAVYLVPGAKVLPSFHPLMVMQQWKFFPVVVGDLMKAARQAALGPVLTYPKKEILIEPTLTDMGAYLPILARSDLLSVDIETGWGQITCIGFAPDAERSLVVPFLDIRQTSRNYWADEQSEAAAWRFVETVMGLPVPKLGQNFGAYDGFWFLKKRHIRTVNLLHDTRLIHHALYPELPKDLEFMGASYTEQGPWKYWGRAAQKEKRDD